MTDKESSRPLDDINPRPGTDAECHEQDNVVRVDFDKKSSTEKLRAMILRELGAEYMAAMLDQMAESQARLSEKEPDD